MMAQGFAELEKKIIVSMAQERVRLEESINLLLYRSEGLPEKNGKILDKMWAISRRFELNNNGFDDIVVDSLEVHLAICVGIHVDARRGG